MTGEGLGGLGMHAASRQIGNKRMAQGMEIGHAIGVVPVCEK